MLNEKRADKIIEEEHQDLLSEAQLDENND